MKGQKETLEALKDYLHMDPFKFCAKYDLGIEEALGFAKALVWVLESNKQSKNGEEG